MLTAAARTHVGRVRSQNEDAAVCRAEHGLFAVIDGMGGQEAGEVAAAIAAQALGEIPNDRGLTGETVLAQALREARARILRQGESQAAQRDMGAVATAVRFDDDGRHFAVAHVGDTRAWLVGAGGVRLLTRDHVERVSEGKPKVSRDLGRRTMPQDWVDTARHAAVHGDVLVVASDGLYDPVPEAELARVLVAIRKERTAPDAACGKLVSLALLHGGPDNVTVVVVRVGRYRRGPRRRLGLAVSAGLFGVLVGLAGVALMRPDPDPVALPDRVTGTYAVDAPSLSIAAGEATTIAPGATLSLRGVAFDATDWTVEVAEGASLRIERSVVTATAGLDVRLAEGASLIVEDARIEAGSLRVRGPADSRVSLAHTVLSTDAPPSFEGELQRTDGPDVRILIRSVPAAGVQGSDASEAPKSEVAPEPSGDAPPSDAPAEPAEPDAKANPNKARP